MAEVQVNWTEIPGSKIRVTSMVHMAIELAMIKAGYSSEWAQQVVRSRCTCATHVCPRCAAWLLCTACSHVVLMDMQCECWLLFVTAFCLSILLFCRWSMESAWA